MARYTSPLLARGELTGAVSFLQRDIRSAEISAQELARMEGAIPDIHLTALRQAHAKLGDLIKKMETAHEAA